jgi:hypothetical protein
MIYDGFPTSFYIDFLDFLAINWATPIQLLILLIVTVSLNNALEWRAYVR